MIAASPSPPVAYLWEPFSVLHRPGVCAARFPLWFTYLTSENGGPYIGPIADMLAFRYRTGAELRALRSPKDLGRLVRDRRRFRRFRELRSRPLLKDPIAVFSAGWLADTFDMDVVVLVRHPAAFVDSVVARSLRHPFGDFLAQPLLLRDHLGSFEAEIRRFERKEQPLLEQGILLWRMIHHVILGYRADRPGWSFERLEDLGRDPVGRFGQLFERLGQAFDDGTAATIEAHSAPSNPASTSDPADHRRDSRASITTWKRRLAQDQIDRIREAVEPISRAFYADADW
jgi:hypothetical protein